MTERCELCGRAYAQGAITPSWFPHNKICDRRKCRAAARDAVVAVYQAREDFGDLAGAIAGRHRAQYAPFGYRTDTMAKIDVVEGRDWWATNVAKRTGL